MNIKRVSITFSKEVRKILSSTMNPDDYILVMLAQEFVIDLQKFALGDDEICQDLSRKYPDSWMYFGEESNGGQEILAAFEKAVRLTASIYDCRLEEDQQQAQPFGGIAVLVQFWDEKKNQVYNIRAIFSPDGHGGNVQHIISLGLGVDAGLIRLRT